jgi:hypothetical protein
MTDKANTDTKQRYESRLTLGISYEPRTEPVRGSCYDSGPSFRENLFVRWFEHKHAFTQASIKKASFVLLLYKYQYGGRTHQWELFFIDQAYMSHNLSLPNAQAECSNVYMGADGSVHGDVRTSIGLGGTNVRFRRCGGVARS